MATSKNLWQRITGFMRSIGEWARTRNKDLSMGREGLLIFHLVDVSEESERMGNRNIQFSTEEKNKYVYANIWLGNSCLVFLSHCLFAMLQAEVIEHLLLRVFATNSKSHSVAINLSLGHFPSFFHSILVVTECEIVGMEFI